MPDRIKSEPPLLDHVPVPLLLGHQDAQGVLRVDYATPMWLELHGVERQSVAPGREFEALLAESLHASEFDAALDLIRRALARKGPVSAQWRVQQQDQTRLLAVQAQSEWQAPTEQGANRRWSLVEQDITLQFQSAVRARTLSKELQTMAAVAEKTGNAVVFFDRSWRVRWLNAGASNLLALPRDAAIGLSYRDFFRLGEDHGPTPEPRLVDALSRGEAAVLDLQLTNHRHQAYNLRLELQGQFDERGRWEGALVVGNDTTNMHQLQHALEKALRSAQAANLARDEFLSNMSHELRTPLSTVLGMADLLQMDEALTEQQSNFVGSIRSAGASLLGVLNDILLYTKLEAGYQRVVSEPLHVQAVLDQVQSLFMQRAVEKKLQFSLSCEPDATQALLGDALRLSQVLSNYVDNAIKFTDQGSVQVQVVSQQSDEKSVLLKFSVQDTGMGISAKDQEGLFTPFHQVDSSAARAHGGTGLGLSICNKLADLMGGEVGVDSVEDQGSCFWFTARLVRPSPSQAAQAPQEGVFGSTAPVLPQHAGAFQGCQVMVVDDVPTNVAVVAAYLRYMGVEVTMCGGGVQAVELAQAQSFDLILMDMQMPDLDGMMATQAIHAQPANSRLPIVAISAGVLPSDVAEARRAGMLDHLGKPVRFERLYAVLQRYLVRRAPNQTPQSPASAA